MKILMWYVLILGLAVAGTGCGSSSSDNGNQAQLDTDKSDLNDFCFRNPDSPSCEDVKNDANNIGLSDYWNVEGDQDYLGGSGLCGCDAGQRPGMYNSLATCRPVFNETVEQNYRRGYRFHLRVGGRDRDSRHRDGKKGSRDRNRIRFEFVSYQERESYYSNRLGGDNCYQDVEAFCTRPSDCTGIRRDGRFVPASCSENFPGERYGKCI